MYGIGWFKCRHAEAEVSCRRSFTKTITIPARSWRLSSRVYFGSSGPRMERRDCNSLGSPLAADAGRPFAEGISCLSYFVCIWSIIELKQGGVPLLENSLSKGTPHFKLIVSSPGNTHWTISEPIRPVCPRTLAAADDAVFCVKNYITPSEKGPSIAQTLTTTSISIIPGSPGSRCPGAWTMSRPCSPIGRAALPLHILPAAPSNASAVAFCSTWRSWPFLVDAQVTQTMRRSR
jgi:hypothetical protein